MDNARVKPERVELFIELYQEKVSRERELLVHVNSTNISGKYCSPNALEARKMNVLYKQGLQEAAEKRRQEIDDKRKELKARRKTIG